MRWLVCTLLLGWGLAWSPVVASARPASRRATPITTGPADSKELHPQPKTGDPVASRRRPVSAGVLPPLRRRRVVITRRKPRSLDTDPVDLIALPIDRERFVFAASPRLRSGAWFSVYGMTGRSVRFREYEPEIVYDKKDTVLMTEVGGALRLGRFELSMNLPLVGQYQGDFYQKGVVDHEVNKVDRMDLALTLKVGFRFPRGKDLWLLTPYFTLGTPTGSRKQYTTSIGGREVQQVTAGPKAFAALPGLAVGWRRGMFSAVVSVGILTRVLSNHKLTPEQQRGDISVSWLGAYQFAFIPWRDIVLILGFSHVHQLKDRTVGEPEDLFFFTPGVRFQPWAGLYGHAGVSVPMDPRSKEGAPVTVTLSAGWEFQ